jgi:hypothetical protein
VRGPIQHQNDGVKVLGLATVGIAAVAVATAGCSGNARAYYQVRLSSDAGRVVHVHGCPRCKPFNTLDSGIGMTWSEGRSLPPTYWVEVNGERSNCPPLPPSADAGQAAINVAYLVDRHGRCIRDQAN